MVDPAEGLLLYNVANAAIRPWPYQHLYVPDVFPEDLYAALLENIPDPSAMLPIAEARPVKGYKERFVLDPTLHAGRLPADQAAFWSRMDALLRGGRFRDLLLAKFSAVVRQRFEANSITFVDETLLVEDITHYALGPHTDAQSKVVTVLFYLPKDPSQAHLGTSLYIPKERGRLCPGGPHHPRDQFDRVATMPFLPNSMFAFVKTSNSFHGVEPVTDPEVRRWLLLYDIKAHAPPQADAA